MNQLPHWVVQSSIEEDVEYLVPHRRGVKGSRWRLSYSTLERDTLLQAGKTMRYEYILMQFNLTDGVSMFLLGDVVRKVYQALKFFVVLHQNAKEDELPEIPRKSSISSYALKTCLFNYMRFSPPPWEPEDILHHAIGVLRTFPIHSTEIRSFFNDTLTVFYITQASKKTVKEILEKMNLMTTNKFALNCLRVNS